MKFAVRNFRGCAAADIEVSRIALLVGDGGASKSSIIQAIGAAATGQVIPIPGIKKSEALRLVRSGAEKGSVTWEGGGYEMAISYPKAEAKGKGSTPPVSVYAAGLEDIMDLPAAKRAPVMAALLKSDPTAEDLLAAVREAAFHVPTSVMPPDNLCDFMLSLGLKTNSPDDRGLFAAFNRLWLVIQESGWDGAWAKAKEKGQELKGEWKQATGGEAYGADKGEKWRPKVWDDDLAASSLDDLVNAVGDAQARFEAAVAAQAVSGADREALQAQASKFQELRTKLAAAEREERAAYEADTELVSRAAPIVPRKPILCPHCDEAVEVVQDLAGFTLRKGVTRTAAEIAALEQEAEKYRAARAAAKQRHAEAFKLKTELTQQVGAAATAQKKLDEMDAVQSESVNVDAARKDVENATGRLSAFKAWGEATKKHKAIVTNQKIIDLLSPDKGVRHMKLAQTLAAFNSTILGPLCTSAGWKPVTLNEDLEVEYDGRIFPMLCKSEQHRCRFVMQLAIAKLDGSALVLLDDADTLPVSARGGLMKMVVSTGLHAVIAMMVGGVDKAPDLAKMKLGQTYWIGGGTAVPFADVATKKAAE